MWLIRPEWIIHCHRSPILTVDTDPSGERLVTGSTDGSVGIWKFVCLHAETSHDQEPLLAYLEYHDGAVNCVEWCPSGQYFATGSSDHTAIIWVMRTGGVFADIEHWKPCFILRQHKADVQALAWNKKGDLLASGTVDSQIMIWEVSARGAVLQKTLSRHQYAVTSLSFDVMERHMLSSDRQNMFIRWDTETWKPKKMELMQFTDVPLQDRKPVSITADGLFCVYPFFHADKDNFGGQVSRIQKTTLKPEKELIGHKAPVSTIAASPTLYHTAGEPTNVVALGSYDSAVSIWSWARPTPVVIKDLFEGSVNDLAWTKDGKHLIACGNNGYVCCIGIGEEFGRPLNQQEFDKLMLQMHNQFPSHPIMSTVPLKSSHNSQQLTELSAQQEALLADGRKRIQPAQLSTGETPLLEYGEHTCNQPPLIHKVIETISTNYVEGVCPWQALTVKSLIPFQHDCILQCFSVQLVGFKTVIQLSKGNVVQWSVKYARAIKSMTSNLQYIVMFAEPNCTLVLSIDGEQIIPELHTQPIRVYALHQHLFVFVTEDFWLELWDLRSASQTLRIPLLRHFGLDFELKFTENGLPLIAGQAGEGFVFSPALQTWMKVKAPDASCWNAMELDADLLAYRPAELQRMELSKLELDLARLETLGPSEEYRYMLLRYLQLLADNNEQLKLFDAYYRLKDGPMAGLVCGVLAQHQIDLQTFS